MTTVKRDLPLRRRTPDRWAAGVLKDIPTLLNDHAHLEKKAAGNALDLLPHWPGAHPPKRWVRVLTSIACDEVRHLATVARLIERNGGEMTRSHRSTYARDLRALVRKGRTPGEIVDRLLVSALIEARSCERFEILSRCAPAGELGKLYAALWGSEHGHYRVFLELAQAIVPEVECERRWEELLDAEAEIITRQGGEPGIHSW